MIGQENLGSPFSRAASTDTAMPGTCSVEAGRARARLERMEGAQARRGERLGGMAAARESGSDTVSEVG